MSQEQRLADHLAAELAEQFGRKHRASGNHVLAFQNFSEALTLYGCCGCPEYSAVAYQEAVAELEHITWPPGWPTAVVNRIREANAR